MTIINSQLIHEQAIIKDEWQTIELPKINQEVKKQAGKVVLFKLTGEEYPTEEQVNQTIVPESGKILLPLKVLIKYHSEYLTTNLPASAIVEDKVPVEEPKV